MAMLKDRPLGITIRKTIKKDLKQIKRIARKTIRTNDSAFLPLEAIERFMDSGDSDRDIDTGWRRGLTALKGETICGYAIVNAPLLHIIMVSPEFQGIGVGSTLLAHCEVLLSERNPRMTLECFEENQDACAFYRRNGWREETKASDESGLTRVFFAKSLGDKKVTPLSALGLSSEEEATHAARLERGTTMARVTGVRKNLFSVHDGTSQSLVPAAGKVYARADEGGLFPATGDWVILNGQRITSVVPRKNALSRGASGNRGAQETSATRSQIIASNLDWVFIVCGLDRDFNLRRIERYLTLVYNCGCTPVILLSKVDLHESVDAFVDEVESIAFGVPVHPISCLSMTGMGPLGAYLTPGKTVALLGSSGVGKSTLVNHLAGKEIQTTRQVSAHGSKGVHTTTTRDLIQLPGGGLLIDNPGIREIAFWDTGSTERAFPEIETWARSCRFPDCTHNREPGCRVKRACEEGELSHERLESYFKQQKELTFLMERDALGASRVEKKQGKWIAGEVRKMKKMGKMKH